MLTTISILITIWILSLVTIVSGMLYFITSVKYTNADTDKTESPMRYYIVAAFFIVIFAPVIAIKVLCQHAYNSRKD